MSKPEQTDLTYTKSNRPNPRFIEIDKTLKAKQQGAINQFRRSCKWELGIDPDQVHLAPGDSRRPAFQALEKSLREELEKAVKEHADAANKIVDAERQEIRHREVIAAIAGNTAHQAHCEKLFPKGVPDDSDLVDAIVRLNSMRTNENTDRDILRELMGEPATNCPNTKRMEARIRRARSDGRTTLPARRSKRTKRTAS